MTIAKSIEKILPELIPSEEFPPGIEPFMSNGPASITSKTWRGGRFRRARLCDLKVPGKFTAETLVIYPESEYDFPIFGCEYLRIGEKKFFGGIDFHPISNSRDYAKDYLTSFPDTTKTDSKFYDLSEFFSSKFWIDKRGEDFYPEYLDLANKYLNVYKTCAKEADPTKNFLFAQSKYDFHMAANDPARGILKAYFSADFAEQYIHKFLFNRSEL
jgi:hypothetical protein